MISSVAEVQVYLKDEHNIDKKPWYIAKIMREQLGMRYRKIVPVSMKTNSERNLVLRQQFAQQLIRLLNAGKRILNIDQTWLGMSDFRRRKWQAPGTTNSMPKKAMLPRITMFCGLDTNGNTYLSLM